MSPPPAPYPSAASSRSTSSDASNAAVPRCAATASAVVPGSEASRDTPAAAKSAGRSTASGRDRATRFVRMRIGSRASYASVDELAQVRPEFGLSAGDVEQVRP